MLITLIVAILIIVLVVALVIVRRQRRKPKQAVTGAVAGADNKQVYVGNLSYQVSEQDLQTYFNQYGAIDQVRIVRSHGSGRSKGFGFVTYRAIADAQKALTAHGQKYQGRTIVVRIAKPR